MTIIEAAIASLKGGEIGIHRREDQRAEPVGASAGLRPDLPEHPTGRQLPAGHNSTAKNTGKAYFGPERRIAERRQTRLNILLDTRTSDRRAGAETERPALA